MFENSVTYQFIANVASGMDGSVGTITPNDLPEGGVGIFTLNGNSVVNDAASTTALVRVAGRKNGVLNFSPPFAVSDLTEAQGSEYEKPVEQISYVGFNTSSSSLDLLTNTSYVLGLRLNHTQGVYNNTPMLKSIPFWLSHVDDSEEDKDTQLRLARGLMTSFVKQFKRSADKSVICERVSTASAADITTATMLKVTKGSTAVTGHTCADGDTIALANIATVSADDTVSFPSCQGKTFTISVTHADEDHRVLIGDKSLQTTTSGGTTTTGAAGLATLINNAFPNGEVRATSSVAVITITYGENFKALPPVIAADTAAAPLDTVYTVGDRTKISYVPTAISTSTMTLDVPWQGESGYIATGNNARHGDAFYTAAAGVTNWGLYLVGNTPFVYDPKVGPPHQVSFGTSFSRVLNRSDREDGVTSDAAADITDSVSADPGSGTYKQVSYAEIWKAMNEGNSVVSHYPPTKYSETAKLNYDYARMYLNGVNAGYTSTGTGQAPVSKFTIAIAASDEKLTSHDGLHTILGITL